MFFFVGELLFIDHDGDDGDDDENWRRTDTCEVFLGLFFHEQGMNFFSF